MRRSLNLSELAALMLFLSAVPTEVRADDPPPASGQLLIAGGGVRADNAAVYARLFELLPPESLLCVIPTASATPRDSAANAIRDLMRHAPEGTTITLIELTTDDPARADDTGAADQVRACGAIWFTGGDQSRIARVFRPRGRATAALAAAQEVLAEGGIIAGSSAGAAMMSDPMITGGSSRDWLARAEAAAPEDGEDGEDGNGNAAADRLRIGHGLGFFPYGIVDQHFLARGRLGRLVLALEARDVPRGYGIADNRAMHVDLSSGRIETIGAAAVVLVDVEALTRDGGWRNVRLTLLGHGDLMDGPTGEVKPASRRTVLVPTDAAAEDRDEKQTGDEPAEASAQDNGALDPWSRDAVLKLLRQLAENPGIPAIAMDDDVELRLTADSRTRFLIDPENDQDLCAIDVRLDLIVR